MIHFYIVQVTWISDPLQVYYKSELENKICSLKTKKVQKCKMSLN